MKMALIIFSNVLLIFVNTISVQAISNKLNNIFNSDFTSDLDNLFKNNLNIQMNEGY